MIYSMERCAGQFYPQLAFALRSLLALPLKCVRSEPLSSKGRVRSPHVSIAGQPRVMNVRDHCEPDAFPRRARVHSPSGVFMHCSKCGADNRETAKFCDSCGAALRQVATATDSGLRAAPTAGERRHLTKKESVIKRPTLRLKEIQGLGEALMRGLLAAYES
jgi:hypothetical protein